MSGEWIVTVEGRVTERYAVVAASAADAKDLWSDGVLISSEVWDSEVVSAAEDDS